jgi:transcriptional regulator with XRE-family HTH domain
MTIGEYFKSLREESRVTQKEIADLLKLSTTYHIKEVESGTFEPKPEYLKDWCEKIGAQKNRTLNLMMSSYRSRVRRGLGL